MAVLRCWLPCLDVGRYHTLTLHFCDLSDGLIALDFFTVSLTVAPLSETFGRPTADITWGITCSLMTRSVGAIIFGFVADRFGRKPPYIICCGLFIILELATGFCQTYYQFIAVRSLYGVAMGG